MKWVWRSGGTHVMAMTERGFGYYLRRRPIHSDLAR